MDSLEKGSRDGSGNVSFGLYRGYIGITEKKRTLLFRVLGLGFRVLGFWFCEFESSLDFPRYDGGSCHLFLPPRMFRFPLSTSMRCSTGSNYGLKKCTVNLKIISCKYPANSSTKGFWQS